MTRVVVIGSGASAVHCALSALEAGAAVTIVDVGYPPPTPQHPEVSFEALKDALDDPVDYFLGGGRGVVYPGVTSSYYGHPPSKDYVFAVPEGFKPKMEHMRPAFSFARGGLAGAWTAGAYQWTQADLAQFPFSCDTLEPFYRTITQRIGVTGAPDDLDPYLPIGSDHLPPLPLDAHSEHLLERYRANRSRSQDDGFILGRSRVATLSKPVGTRQPCQQLGRCLWGCPTWSLYHPAVTLEECQLREMFEYRPGHYVTHLEYDSDGTVNCAVANDLASGTTTRIEGDRFVLAAGGLNSTKIYLESWYRATGEQLTLTGLMDNRQVHVPFLSPKMIGQAVEQSSYQFHHLAFALPGSGTRAHVHGQITTLKAASIHPILGGIPVGLRLALQIFQTVRAGLGVANVNLPDERRPESRVTLDPGTGLTGGQLDIRYVAAMDEAVTRGRAVAKVKHALRTLGCWIPPGMTRVLPMGTSAHYAGTLPMTDEIGEHTADPDGRLRNFRNLFIADGAGFPVLPAKNLTLTLMANAARIGSRLGPA